MKKRIFSLFLALVMVASLLPTATLADGNVAEILERIEALPSVEDFPGMTKGELQAVLDEVEAIFTLTDALPPEQQEQIDFSALTAMYAAYDYLDSAPVENPAAPEPHTYDIDGDEVTFQPWTSTNSLPTEKDNYYLTEDVTLTSTWTPASGTILYLNGRSLIFSSEGSYVSKIHLESGRSLRLMNGTIKGASRKGNVTPMIEVKGKATLDCDGITFTENVIGGSVIQSTNDGAKITVKDSKFMDCTVGNMLVQIISDSDSGVSTAKFQNCEFSENKLAGLRSIIQVSGTANCTVEGCTITNNTRDENDTSNESSPYVFYFDEAVGGKHSVTIKDCTIMNNFTDKTDGYILCSYSGAAKVNLVGNCSIYVSEDNKTVPVYMGYNSDYLGYNFVCAGLLSIDVTELAPPEDFHFVLTGSGLGSVKATDGSYTIFSGMPTGETQKITVKGDLSPLTCYSDGDKLMAAVVTPTISADGGTITANPGVTATGDFGYQWYSVEMNIAPITSTLEALGDFDSTAPYVAGDFSFPTYSDEKWTSPTPLTIGGYSDLVIAMDEEPSWYSLVSNVNAVFATELSGSDGFTVKATALPVGAQLYLINPAVFWAGFKGDGDAMEYSAHIDEFGSSLGGQYVDCAEIKLTPGENDIYSATIPATDKYMLVVVTDGEHEDFADTTFSDAVVTTYNMDTKAKVQNATTQSIKPPESKGYYCEITYPEGWNGTLVSVNTRKTNIVFATASASITVTEKEGATAPVYGTAKNADQLYKVETVALADGTTLTVQWKHVDGDTTTWDTASPATGLSVDADGMVTTAENTPAGDYVFRIITGTEGEDGFVSSNEITLTIGKATPTYTAPTGLTATYGQTLADVALGTGFAWEDATTNVGSVGTHNFNVKFTPTDTANYNVVENIEVTVTVSPKKLTKPSAATTAFTYNNAAQTLTVTDFDSTTMTQSGTVSATNAGDYTATYSLKDTTNYQWADESTTDVQIAWKINKAEVTAPTINSKVFTGSPLTADVDCTGKPYTVTTNLGGTNVGSYNVVLTLTDSDNYKWADGTAADAITLSFSITQAQAPTITFPTASGVTYDPTATLSNVALTGGSTEYGTFAWETPSTVPTVSVSAYSVVFTPSESSVQNYGLTTQNQDVTLTIAKATVTAPTISSKVYTGNPQTAEVAESALYNVTTNEGGTNVGSYDVVLTLSDPANYQWTDSDAADKTLTFQITKQSNSWTTQPAIADVTYGTAISPVGAATFGTVVITYVGTGSTTYNNTTAPTNAGSYKATFSVAETDDYAGLSEEVIFTIAQKEVGLEWSTLTADDLVYDKTAKTLTATATQLESGDECTVTVALNTAAGTNVNVGTFSYKATALSNGNYMLPENKVSDTYTITPKEVTLSWTAPASLVYSKSEKTPTVAVSNLETGDSCTVTAALTSGDNNVSVGTFTYTASALDNANYKLPENKVSDTYTITPKEITITPNANQKKTYGENDPAFTYTNTALCGEDTISGALSRAEGNTYNASGYAITLGTLTAGNNYTLTLSETAPVFMIEKKAVTVADVTVADKVYNNKTDGVSITGYTLTGREETDNLTLTGVTGTYASAAVSNEQTVNLNASSGWALGGTAKDNYVLATIGQPTSTTGKITAFDLTNATVTLSPTSAPYTGEAIEPTATVTFDGTNAIPAGDYKVSYGSNTNFGTATVTVSADSGNVTGSTSANFTITAAVNPAVTKPAAKTGLVYTAQAQALVSEGTFGTAPTDSTAFEYALGTNATNAPSSGWGSGIPTGTDAGIYYVWYRWTSTNYIGIPATCVTVTVAPKAVTAPTVDAIPDQQFTGEPITPAVTVKLDEQTLTPDTDYTVAYQDNTMFTDAAKATVTFCGNYSGTLETTFRITAFANAVNAAMERIDTIANNKGAVNDSMIAHVKKTFGLTDAEAEAFKTADAARVVEILAAAEAAIAEATDLTEIDGLENMASMTSQEIKTALDAVRTEIEAEVARIAKETVGEINSNNVTTSAKDVATLPTGESENTVIPTSGLPTTVEGMGNILMGDAYDADFDKYSTLLTSNPPEKPEEVAAIEATFGSNTRIIEVYDFRIEMFKNGNFKDYILDANGLLVVNIDYETEGKEDFQIYRYHNYGTDTSPDYRVDVLTTTENANHEYIEITDSGIKMHVRFFCTYALAYDEHYEPSPEAEETFSGVWYFSRQEENGGAAHLYGEAGYDRSAFSLSFSNANVTLTSGLYNALEGTHAYKVVSAEAVRVNAAQELNGILIEDDGKQYLKIELADSTIYLEADPSSRGGGVVPTYAVTGANSENGKVTINTKYACEDQTVTVTVTPDEGYVLDTLTIRDKNGKELELTKLSDTKYTFKMPSGKVSVSATFKEVKTVCPQDASCVYAKFTDADTKEWYHDGVHFCVENDIMKGISDTLFAPDGTTTRAMIVTMLWRMEGEPVVNYTMSFTDVPADEWYAEAIRWAQSNKIVEGYSAEAFGPNDPITREQMALILYRYAKFHEIDVASASTLAGYTDTDKVSTWALDAVKWANAVELMKGRTATTLVPDADITRAEAATMIQRYCETFKK